MLSDVSLDLGDSISVKFHAQSLYNVCVYEANHGLSDPVPADYFDEL